MRILITGAAGFIGYNLVKYLTENGHTVFAGIHERTRHESKTDLFTFSKINRQIKRLLTHIPRDRIISGDASNGFVTKQFLKSRQIEVVIHSAAQSLTPQAKKEQDEADTINTNAWRNTNTMRINVDGTDKLAATCEALSIELDRPIGFIYLSSMHATAARDINNAIPDLNHPTRPQPALHYHCSKLYGEQLLERYHQLDAVIIRLPRMIGPYQYTTATTAALRERAMLRKPITDNELDNKPFSVTHISKLFPIISSVLTEGFTKGGRNKHREPISFSSSDDIYTNQRELVRCYDKSMSRLFGSPSIFKNHEDESMTQKNIGSIEDITDEIMQQRITDAIAPIQRIWKQKFS